MKDHLSWVRYYHNIKHLSVVFSLSLGHLWSGAEKLPDHYELLSGS